MSNFVGPSLSFSISSPISASRFGPRLGNLSFRRQGSPNLNIDTPGLFASTSRGVVPHLSRDHHKSTKAIRWVHIPFETFLEQLPPIPTLQPGRNPLHTFLGYPPSQHILSTSIRDPYDGREMPPNGNGHVSAYCVRGVRKVTPADWRSYVLACKPDVVVALSDTPFTKPPYSQKRLTKSIERSAAWLADLLRPSGVTSSSENGSPERLNVLVHMAGEASIPARRAFSESLIEVLYGKEAELVSPFKCLNEGVAGYVFDLVPLRLSLLAEEDSGADSETTAPDVLDSQTTPIPTKVAIRIAEMVTLLEASLSPLSDAKLRLVNSAISPHEVLRLVLHIGIDLFDAHWAQRAADIGVALDFQFPVGDVGPSRRSTRKRDLGYNLYDSVYAHDFSRLAECFLDGASASDPSLACPCAACSPISPSSHISHDTADAESPSNNATPHPNQFLPPYTRAYLHHLLHTHEMSSHSLLVMHNLAVLDAFFAGIRGVLAHPDGGVERFASEVEKFEAEYDEELTIFDEAKVFWSEVEMARGKGRLAREKAKQVEATLGTAVEL